MPGRVFCSYIEREREREREREINIVELMSWNIELLSVS
jgi:hypothetical protein